MTSRQALCDMGFNVFALDLAFKSLTNLLPRMKRNKLGIEVEFRDSRWRVFFELVETKDKNLADVTGANHVER